MEVFLVLPVPSILRDCSSWYQWYDTPALSPAFGCDLKCRSVFLVLLFTGWSVGATAVWLSLVCRQFLSTKFPDIIRSYSFSLWICFGQTFWQNRKQACNQRWHSSSGTSERLCWQSMHRSRTSPKWNAAVINTPVLSLLGQITVHAVKRICNKDQWDFEVVLLWNSVICPHTWPVTNLHSCFSFRFWTDFLLSMVL